jgi:hypothetical protein
MGFELQVLTAVSEKSILFWDVPPFNQVHIYHRFGGT